MEMKGQVNTKGELSAIKYIFMVANELGMVINRPGLFNGNRRIKSDIPSVEILECILNVYTCRGVVSYIPVSIEYDIDTTAKKGYVNLSSVTKGANNSLYSPATTTAVAYTAESDFVVSSYPFSLVLNISKTTNLYYYIGLTNKPRNETLEFSDFSLARFFWFLQV